MKYFRDPLVHFILLGALLFIVYDRVSEDSAEPLANSIVVSSNDISQIRTLFQKQWNRPPSDQELENLIDAHIREQVYYREALALNLDEDDTIVRRRLVQKMEFIVSDVALPQDPGDEELGEYYRAHPDRYMEPARLSFTHIYFNPDRRGANTESDAGAALLELQQTEGGPAGGPDFGDRFMLEYRYADISGNAVSRSFGSQFAEALLELEPGKWHGPVISGFGVHLVYVEEFAPASTRPFESVKSRVSTDYLFDLNKKANEKVFEGLLERYDVVVEGRS